MRNLGTVSSNCGIEIARLLDASHCKQREKRKGSHSMQLSGIQSLFTDVPAQSTQTSQSGGSFDDYLDGASGNGVQAFTDYMKETPAQQMFTSFLGSQHISQSQYDAMTPQQQEALVEKFEQQLKQKMEAGSTNVSSVNL